VIYRSLSIHASIIFIKVVLHPSPDWPSDIKIETPAKTPTPNLSPLLPTIDPQLKHQPLIPPPSLSFNTTNDSEFPQENTSFFITIN
jgi:hypothetical protein